MEKVFVGRRYAVDLENYSAFALPDTCFCSEVSITVDVFVTLAWPSDAPAAAILLFLPFIMIFKLLLLFLVLLLLLLFLVLFLLFFLRLLLLCLHLSILTLL